MGFAVSLLHHNFDGVTFYSIPSYNLFPLKKKKNNSHNLNFTMHNFYVTAFLKFNWE